MNNTNQNILFTLKVQKTLETRIKYFLFSAMSEGGGWSEIYLQEVGVYLFDASLSIKYTNYMDLTV